MAWVTHDFECQDCGFEFEEMYKRDEFDQIECLECSGKNLKKLLSSPGLGTFSMMNADQQRQSMINRSAKHTQKLIDKEPEKIKHGAGIERRTRKPQVGYGD